MFVLLVAMIMVLLITHLVVLPTGILLHMLVVAFMLFGIADMVADVMFRGDVVSDGVCIAGVYVDGEYLCDSWCCWVG